jgi:signal transduction histidine kinase
MNATCQRNPSRSVCLSEMRILRDREINEVPSNPVIPETPIAKVSSAAGMNKVPQICDGCKDCESLAIAGRMAQLVSHDLLNHLTAIYSNIEFISESKTSNVERGELLEEVRAVIRDMTGMLNSLLLLAKTGKPPHPRWRSLNELVEHAAFLVRAHPDARDVDLFIQEAAPVVCWMDCAKVGSAIYNLLLNACQAARLGLAQRRVQVTLAEDQRFIHIRVVDSGLGVPHTIRKTLFQPFVSTERINGIGLGLSIVDCTAREHGGYIDLEESGNRRTVFGFHISKYALENLAPRSQP